MRGALFTKPTNIGSRGRRPSPADVALSTAPTPIGELTLSALLALRSLRLAWRRVRANGGGAGGDGETIDQFEARLEESLSDLVRDLRAGNYRPGPLRRLKIAKPHGGQRELSIPCVRDRIVQTAIMMGVAPVLDAKMSTHSYAYRPGRSVAQALGAARAAIGAGRRTVVDADIRQFFPSVPHASLLAELAIWIDDRQLLALLGVIIGTDADGGRGLPQGAPLSPMLANLYLHPLDRLLEAAGIIAFRYADDFIILCRSRFEAECALAMTSNILFERGLSLNLDKTWIAPADQVRFLGERLWPPPKDVIAKYVRQDAPESSVR